MAESPAAAFFTRDGGSFVPGPHAGSPWDRRILHGRLIAALAAHVTERSSEGPAFQPSRLTVDLFRPPPLAPLEVHTRTVRDGKRIRVVDAVVTSDGVEVGRTSCVMLRRTDQPSGMVWRPEDWDAPHPEEVDSPAPRSGGDGQDWGWVPPWDMRPMTPGGFGVAAQKRTWIRENRELVAGEPLTPFVRVATAADLANPLANSGDEGLKFINADITLYLHRLPESDWIGFEVADHGSTEGVAVGSCRLYDARGAIGHSLVCGVANERRQEAARDIGSS